MRFKKEISPVDKRLAELEREIRQVRRSMRTAEKKPVAQRHPPDAPPGSLPRPTSPAKPPPDPGHGELFAYANREPGSGRGLGERSVDEKRQFAHYFASGSFVGTVRPPRETRRIQRNKAIFMVVLVLVVGFILYSIFR